MWMQRDIMGFKLAVEFPVYEPAGKLLVMRDGEGPQQPCGVSTTTTITNIEWQQGLSIKPAGIPQIEVFCCR